MTPTDHQQLAERIDLDGARVLDIGSGAGALVRWLRSQGAEPVGLECGDTMLALAREADHANPETYVDGVGQDLPFGDGSFDAAVFSYSLHHVPAEHMATALEEAARVVRPGGTVYVMEPIADGPSFEVTRLVDDETHVRALAQTALAAVDATNLTLVDEATYGVLHHYRDAQDWEAVVVGIDPTRAEAMAANREAVASAFANYGTPSGDGYDFAQEIRVHQFTKPE